MTNGKRLLDVIVSAAALVLLSPFLALIALAISLSSPGPALHWSERIGRDNQSFWMPKFRTMRTETPQLPTHLLRSPEAWITPFGRFLRKTSLDELPQLWCVFRGQMSLVGPRPALFNQSDLIGMRTEAGVHRLVPGLTGWAQINGRDELSLPEKVRFDADYAKRMSFVLDAKIMLRTIAAAIVGDGIDH